METHPALSLEASKTTSAELTLRLYELRRDREMRSAREWYLSKFDPKSADEIVELIMSSYDASQQYRMVTSYWDMACSFVNNGAIDRDVFVDANSEYVAVYTKLHPFLTEVQEKYRAGYLKQLETLVLSLPDVEKLMDGRRKLLDSWGKSTKRSVNVGFSV
jgi:hypothetical protein